MNNAGTIVARDTTTATTGGVKLTCKEKLVGIVGVFNGLSTMFDFAMDLYDMEHPKVVTNIDGEDELNAKHYTQRCMEDITVLTGQRIETVTTPTSETTTVYDSNNIDVASIQITPDVIGFRSGIAGTAPYLGMMMGTGGCSFIANNDLLLHISNGNVTLRASMVGKALVITPDDLTWGGTPITANATITHETNISDPSIGRFCETTGEIYDGYTQVGITDCITKQKLCTTLSTKLLGIITSDNTFASHGDVLVKVDDGEYKLGDILVPTATSARVASEEEKLFIMVNGLPRVRVTAVVDERIPFGVACFIS
jgi:hypothetical protein